MEISKFRPFKLIIVLSIFFVGCNQSIPIELESENDYLLDCFDKLYKRDMNGIIGDTEAIEAYESLIKKYVKHLDKRKKMGFGRTTLDDDVLSTMEQRIVENKLEGKQQMDSYNEYSDENEYQSDDESDYEDDSYSQSKDSYSGSKCQNCGFGSYGDEGICNYCNTASPSRASEARRTLQQLQSGEITQSLIVK